jgi:crossover junction endodeoxyribonuclease RuvC
MATYLGLDMSLTRTGIGFYSRENGHSSMSLKGGDDRGVMRLKTMADKLDVILDGIPDLEGCAIEGYAFAATAGKGKGKGGAQTIQGVRDTAEWQGVARLILARRNKPIVLVPPTVLKKFATGKGFAEKEEVLAVACKRYKFTPKNTDESDAITLAHIAYCRLHAPTGLLSHSFDALQSVELAY